MRTFVIVHGWLKRAWPHALGHVIGTGILLAPSPVLNGGQKAIPAVHSGSESVINVETTTKNASGSSIEVTVITDSSATPPRVKVTVKTKVEHSNKPKRESNKQRRPR